MRPPDTSDPPPEPTLRAAGAAAPAAIQAIILAGDALDRVDLDKALIHRALQAEAWQAALGDLYQAMINLFAARCAMESGQEVDAAALHDQVMRRLRRNTAAALPPLEALTVGDLRQVPPMGRLVLFAALLRETALALDALPRRAATQDAVILARIDATLRRLGDRVVALADPMLADAARRQ